MQGWAKVGDFVQVRDYPEDDPRRALKGTFIEGEITHICEWKGLQCYLVQVDRLVLEGSLVVGVSPSRCYVPFVERVGIEPTTSRVRAEYSAS